MADMKFINGMIFKLPNPKAPDFVKGSVSFKIDEMISTLSQYKAETGKDWMNADLKVGKSGKAYAALNEWEADKSKAYEKEAVADARSEMQQPPPDFDDPMPF